MKYIITSIWLFFCSISFLQAQQYVTTGKIVAIKDGDTYQVLLNNHQTVTVRLAHIDCPEKSQPFGQTAKKMASAICFGKNVYIRHNGKLDRNKRLIGEIFLNDLCVNKELVKKGLAWHFKKYSQNQSYSLLEQKAKIEKIGLWKEPSPTPPWIWRKMKTKF